MSETLSEAADILIKLATRQADRIGRLEAALRDVLAECDEAPTDNSAWVVAIQQIARAALDKDAGIGCGKSVIEPWAEEQDK